MKLPTFPCCAGGGSGGGRCYRPALPNRVCGGVRQPQAAAGSGGTRRRRKWSLGRRRQQQQQHCSPAARLAAVARFAAHVQRVPSRLGCSSRCVAETMGCKEGLFVWSWCPLLSLTLNQLANALPFSVRCSQLERLPHVPTWNLCTSGELSFLISDIAPTRASHAWQVATELPPCLHLFALQAQSPACRSCSPGTFAYSWGSSYCKNCIEGTYAPAGEAWGEDVWRSMLLAAMVAQSWRARESIVCLSYPLSAYSIHVFPKTQLWSRPPQPTPRSACLVPPTPPRGRTARPPARCRWSPAATRLRGGCAGAAGPWQNVLTFPVTGQLRQLRHGLLSLYAN
jgi:hypothetical protein